MDETIFPPSPNWCLPKIIASREDGTVGYGSNNNIVIVKVLEDNKLDLTIINNAHMQRITAVGFSYSSCDSLQDTIVSCSDDGYVKLWNIASLSVLMGHKSHWDQKGDLGKVISLDWSLSNPNHIISVADNNTIILWNILLNITEKFFFQKLNATCVSCCPYNEKIVAVGSKSGLISVVNLTEKGEILFKLRGHDNDIQSLTWCPIPYNVFKTDELYEEFLLASACQDKDMFIWRVGSDSKCEVKIHIPTASISKKGRDNILSKIGNNLSFLVVLWAEPYKIYLTSSFGELIYFDVKSHVLNKRFTGSDSEKKSNKQLLTFFKQGHCLHSRGLYAATSFIAQRDIALYGKISNKSDLKFKIEANKINFVESFTSNDSTDPKGDKCYKWEIIMPKISPLLWTAGLDKKLVACKSINGELEMVFNVHTVLGSVYYADISPHDPNKIAIATGDGLIRLWNLTEPSGEVQIFWKKIQDRVKSLAWHPLKDGILAYGTSEGRIGVIDTNSNKPPNVFKPNRPDSIYKLSWGPQFFSQNIKEADGNREFCLYAIGSNILSMYKPSKLGDDPLNLSKIIPFQCKKQTDVSWKPDYSLMAVGSEDGSVSIIEPTEFKIVHTVQVYKKFIQSIAWHPSSTSMDIGMSPYHGYFASGSTDNDNEIRIFNCIKEENEIRVEKVNVLKGHYGYIQSVAWSPHIGGHLVSSSADGSVQIWNAITQSRLKNFFHNGYGMPLFSMWSPVNPDIILSGFFRMLCAWRISTQKKTSPQLIPKSKKAKGDIEICLASESVKNIVGTEENENQKASKSNIEMAQLKIETKNVKTKMFSKSWKGHSVEKLNICYSLLKTENSENNGLYYSLPFLCSEESYTEFIKLEEDKLKKASNWTEFDELTLLNGNIKTLLEEKIKTGQLNDFLVSLTPTISPRLWQEACLSYSKSLTEKKMFRKAASYLIVCHKVYEAVQLLLDANLYLEALCLVRSNLPKSDPLWTDVIRKYAEYLFKKGLFLEACECYIYLKEYAEVAKICGKKNFPEYLSLAALASRKCGSHDLESLEATNALFKCFEVQNLELAQRICSDHANLKHLSLINHTYRTICQLDAGDINIKEDILTFVQNDFKTEDINFPSSLETLYNKYAFYRNKNKMYIVVAQELAFASCSKDKDKILTHIIKALSTCYRYTENIENEASPVYKLISWLSPKGFLSENSLFSTSEINLIPKVKSLRAYLCASLAAHLSDQPTFDNVLVYLKELNELKDDLLDKNSYTYYKNLKEVELCERKLITYRTKQFHSKIKNKVEAEKKNLHLLENTNNSNLIEKSVQESFANENEIESKSNTGYVQVSSEKRISSMQKSLSKDILNTQQAVQRDSIDNCSNENIEEKILREMVILNNLKSEIESFEAIRISSPNPVPVYCMLKRLFEGVLEYENTRNILQDLEIKWKLLN